MKSENLKLELHGYIEQADDKTLKAIHTLVKPGMEQLELTKQQIQELDKRKKNHLTGKSKSYSWEQTERMIKAKKK